FHGLWPRSLRKFLSVSTKNPSPSSHSKFPQKSLTFASVFFIISTRKDPRLMKTLRVFARFVSLTRSALIAGVIALILARLPAFATTFTTDTTINVNDTNYDGTDIVVTNYTLTVNDPD